MQIIQNRRAFLAGLSAAGSASLFKVGESSALEAPETTTVRLPIWLGGSYCWAAEFIATELLHADGVTDVRFIQGEMDLDQAVWLERGETDLSINFPSNHIKSIDAGVPILVLSGLHSGCLELIANEGIQSIVELRGKRVGMNGFGSATHMMLSVMASYVGLDPQQDIEWVIEKGDPVQLFIDDQVDAFLGGPPQPQMLHEKKIGHTIVNLTKDPPWSEYFCCMVSGAVDYVTKYPTTTKLVLRALLKAADLCVSDPAWVAQQLVDRGYTPPGREYSLQTLKDIRYDRWRDYDPEDTLRFYALRMQETGMIKSSPQKIIADGTDWHFLNEIKRELKA